QSTRWNGFFHGADLVDTFLWTGLVVFQKVFHRTVALGVPGFLVPGILGIHMVGIMLVVIQQLHDKISEMNGSYYDLRGKIVQAERRIATLTERGEMWAQYNKYKPIRKQLAKVKPEKRELFEQRHSRELILYDAAARYLKELKDSGEEITPKAWQREIDLLTAQKQVDTIDMKAMREELKAVERLRKAADQLARQGQDKSHDRGPER